MPKLVDAVVPGDDGDARRERKRRRKAAWAMMRRQRLHVQAARTRWRDEGRRRNTSSRSSSGTSCSVVGDGAEISLQSPISPPETQDVLAAEEEEPLEVLFLLGLTLTSHKHIITSPRQ
jgi:hypothetical protein